MFHFDVSEKRNKSTIVFLWFLVVVSFAIIGIHFFPFIYDVNSQTREIYLSVRGIELAFGRYTRYESTSIHPSFLYLIGIILGSLGALFLLVFTIWFMVAKKYNRFMFFIFSLSVPCFAGLVATEFFVTQLYKMNNLISFASMLVLQYWYYIALISSSTLFLITFVTIIIIAFSGSKMTVSLEEQN